MCGHKGTYHALVLFSLSGENGAFIGHLCTSLNTLGFSQSLWGVEFLTRNAPQPAPQVSWAKGLLLFGVQWKLLCCGAFSDLSICRHLAPMILCPDLLSCYWSHWLYLVLVCLLSWAKSSLGHSFGVPDAWHIGGTPGLVGKNDHRARCVHETFQRICVSLVQPSHCKIPLRRISKQAVKTLPSCSSSLCFWILTAVHVWPSGIVSLQYLGLVFCCQVNNNNMVGILSVHSSSTLGTSHSTACEQAVMPAVFSILAGFDIVRMGSFSSRVVRCNWGYHCP